MNSKELQQEQKTFDYTVEKLKDQTYFIWELLETRGSNAPGNNISYRQSTEVKNLLKETEKEPYFGRFNVQFLDEEKNSVETFYIGKQGIRDRDENVIVLDWRRPLASVYYNFSPDQPVQQYEGIYEESCMAEVLEKKELEIRDKKIIRIVNHHIDSKTNSNIVATEATEELSINDDFLKQMIETNETTGYLKEIIATIQKEQDRAIRQAIDKNVIIQGVAGSGKSSIALHRLSFLLYNNKHIKPEDVLILGPSNLFISSVKDLLPELNLEGIKQSTVHQLMLDAIKPVCKKKFDMDQNFYFEKVLFKNDNNQERKIISFKGSKVFVNVLDQYIAQLKEQYKNKIQTITLFGESFDKNFLMEIYDGYTYLPFVKRIERFCNHVANRCKELLDKKLQEQQSHFDFVVQIFLKDGGLKPEEFDSLFLKSKNIYQYKSNKLETEYKEIMSAWLEAMKVPDLFTAYKNVISYDMLFIFKNQIESGTLDAFKNYQIKKLTHFDLAPMFYMYLLMYEKPFNFSHIIIDEAQDLSYLHFAALKNITKTMTILGDKDQAIFMEYGQYHWDVLKTSHFQSKEDMLLTLETSYRSTREIIDVANRVLTNQNGLLHSPITSLNRSGEKVSFGKVESGMDLIEKIKLTLEQWKKKYKRIAIIHKDEIRARKLAALLQKEYENDLEYISLEQEVGEKPISVLTSYNCKGMEFDAVILVNINTESFPKDDLHARLLYVLLTRAQQAVKVFYQDTPSALLEGAISELLKPVSAFDDIL